MAAISFAVDVSGNQPAHQNWKSFGCHMGIAKATEGQKTTDPWFTKHAADIRGAGLVFGAYHFAWPNQSALTESAHYIATVKPFAAKGMYHLLDLEPYSDGRNYAGRTAEQIKAYATAWVAEVQKAFPGQPVRVYTPRDNVTKHYPGNSGGYWYPAYPVQGRSFAQAAALARPSVAGAGSVWGWQFTSEPRDMTVIYASPADLRVTVSGPTPAPTPEDDMTAADVWNYKIPVSPDKGAAEVEAARHLRGTAALVSQLNDMVKQLLAQQAASTATIKALAAAIGSGDDVDTIVARVTQAIADTHVQVTIIGADGDVPAAG
ncbi:GH25 family lysozyme [Streptomyces sp. CA-111067]|uniref:GH25 family lysozyme n=1 Tax=Streptomyces sp. CA-111067 TaxID=3240046 RepID=UPI003D97A5D3